MVWMLETAVAAAIALSSLAWLFHGKKGKGLPLALTLSLSLAQKPAKAGLFQEDTPFVLGVWDRQA